MSQRGRRHVRRERDALAHVTVVPRWEQMFVRCRFSWKPCRAQPTSAEGESIKAIAR